MVSRKTIDNAKQEPPQPAPTSVLGVIFRLTWMAYGNLALALLTVLIAQAGALSALDVAFWGVVGVLVSVRYIDVTRLGGLTAEGEPASLRHWCWYTGYLLGASAVLWAFAHGVAQLAIR